MGMSVLATALHATELHVATSGQDSNPGTRSAPLRTIQRGADLAQPGDTITVHEGIYRERINPPRGGTSDAKRIVYQAVPGEKVVITGSEPVKSWVRVTNDTWKATISNRLFGSFNPYSDLIHGDWFNGKGREHHTGAVYLNGDWLVEAAKLDEVLMPAGERPAKTGAFLMNVAWLRPEKGAVQIGADRFAEKHGMRTASCSEGGQCLGWIEDGDWARYAHVDFGNGATTVEIRAASVTGGGLIEIRADNPAGERLGICAVSDTGDWQNWALFKASIKPISGVRDLCLLFKSALRTEPLWFGRVDADSTTLWAQFSGVNPNEQEVEINVRRTVFYPDKPGINYLTVRGFVMRNAATPWAPPTAEQIGLIGTHWSKGWTIENNVISHSVCSGISLGKHGDAFDNTSANSAEGYVKTIERAQAHAIPWTKENIGHHVVRSNTVSHCEQAGIVGSLGCSFSTVTGNVIHDIHVRRLFTGAEMAGIKFHGAIDTEISRNRIDHTCRGLWLDWMAQGTHVMRNLFYENADHDLFVEVDHGPFLIDNNLFLSGTCVLDVSEGGAYAHNLFAGRFVVHPELKRDTPYHPAHSTAVAGLVNTKGGDDRFYNNLFIGRAGKVAGCGLSVYDNSHYPLFTGGNVYCGGAKPYVKEVEPVVLAQPDTRFQITEQNRRVGIRFAVAPELRTAKTAPVTSALLGLARIPQLPYENADGSSIRIGTDYFGKARSETAPTAGPFEGLGLGELELNVW
jgi:hypothetical protein